MSTLHQMVPVFFLIQFLVVLAALVTAMLWAGPEFSLLSRTPARSVRVGLTKSSPR